MQVTKQHPLLMEAGFSLRESKIVFSEPIFKSDFLLLVFHKKNCLYNHIKLIYNVNTKMADPMSLFRLIIKAYVYIDDELRMGISIRKCIYKECFE